MAQRAFELAHTRIVLPLPVRHDLNVPAIRPQQFFHTRKKFSLAEVSLALFAAFPVHAGSIRVPPLFVHPSERVPQVPKVPWLFSQDYWLHQPVATPPGHILP